MTLAQQFHHWLPVSFSSTDGAPTLAWVYFAQHRLTEPFFDQSLDAALRLPFAKLFQHATPPETARDLIAELPHDDRLAPAGFVFHMSRCGSTLVSQAFAADEQTAVYSEPPVVDELLRARYTNPALAEQTQIDWLRWTIGALARRRFPAERRIIIKLDAWSIAELPLIRAAFPEVPWIFLYRDPLEVLVSQLRSPAIYTLPGRIVSPVFDIAFDAAAQMPRAEYCAHLLAQILRHALQHAAAPNGLLINYTQLPQAIPTVIAPHFGIHLTETALAAVFGRHAKSPHAPFASDTEEKRQSADPAVRQLADRELAPLFQQLETLRVAASAPALS